MSAVVLSLFLVTLLFSLSLPMGVSAQVVPRGAKQASDVTQHGIELEVEVGDEFHAGCHNFTTRNSCQTASQNNRWVCGWCRSSGKCVVSAGPYRPRYAKCSEGSWFTKGRCPGVCSQATECSTCASESGDKPCGWCSTTESCVDLNPTGNATKVEGTCAPSLGEKEAGSRRWAENPLWTNQCPADCGQFMNCSSCLLSNSQQGTPGICGWCNSTQTCLQLEVANGGSGLARAPEFCPREHWYSTNCPGFCSGAPTCADCYQMDGLGCGWCNSTLQCLRVNENGNGTRVPGECPNEAVDFYVHVCPANCSSYDGDWCACTEARAAGHVPGHCGWCNSTKTCHEASSTVTSRIGHTRVPGVCLSAVSQWFGQLRCPASCEALSNCSACLDKSLCGWCNATQQCVLTNYTTGMPISESMCPGNNLGGFNNFGCAALSCWQHDTCAKCTTSFGCGWCAGKAAGGGQRCMMKVGQLYRPDECKADLGAFWYSGYGVCPRFCAGRASDCKTCTEQGDCGWCSSNSSCVAINDWANGTKVPGSCPSTMKGQSRNLWTDQCPMDCAQYKNWCSCHKGKGPLGQFGHAERCGWCNSTQTCLQIAFNSHLQPLMPATCPTAHWYPSQCPEFCSQFSTNCSTCLQHVKSCGWCNSTQRCLAHVVDPQISGYNPGYYGPRPGVCPGENSWSIYCETLECGKFSGTSCQECTSISTPRQRRANFCGWCNHGAGSCLSMNRTTNEPLTTCASGWHPTGQQCDFKQAGKN